MAEFRDRTSGDIKTREQIKAENPNVSMPKVWNQDTFDALNIDPVLAGPAASVGQYQVSLRDGVEQNANGDWVEKYVAQDMFADDPDLGTKAEQEAAYQATIDESQAALNRTLRNKLLADSDWTQMNDSPLSSADKTAWAVYRDELRNITDQDFWPGMSDDDWPVAP